MRLSVLIAAVVSLFAGSANAQSPSLVPTKPTPVTAAAATAVSNAKPAKLTREDLASWLDGFLPFALQHGDVAGAVVVVVKDGQVVLQKGYGYSNVAKKTPVDPNRTLFRPGSVSKLFTWTAVMQQVEAGKLDLDADVNRYLDFKVPPFQGKPVTIRNLLTHTPGFDETSKDVVAHDPKGVPPLGPFLKRVLPARVYPPGEVPAYSNYGASLAGYIVQRVSGLSFDDYVDQRIFAPLGMKNSSFRQPLPAALQPDMATAYVTASAPGTPYETVALAPAGSLAATGADMAKFMIAHLQDGELNGQRILQPATARMMHSLPYTTIGPNLDRMLLGFYQIDRNGHRIIGHMGDTQAFHSYLQLFPDDHVGIFLSLDGLGREAAAGPIRGALFEQFADRYFPAASPPAGTRLDAATARRDGALIAGAYDNSRRSQSSFLSLLNLLTQAKVSVDKDGVLTASPFKTFGGAPKRFEEIAPMLWREVGGQERLAPKLKDGKVVMWGEDELSPFMVFLPTPASRNAAWLMPLTLSSLAAMLLTLVLWPVTAWARRRYGGSFSLEGQAATSYRVVRVTAGAAAVTMAAWLVTIFNMLQTGAFTSKLDGWFLLLHLLTIVLFPAAVAATAWNLWVVWRSRPGFNGLFARLWAAVLLIAALTLLWVGTAFHLIGLSLSY